MAWLTWLFLIPVVVGTLYHLTCVVTALRFYRGLRRRTNPEARQWPAVTILKPVHGLEKGLRDNLRSTCLQDYPQFQVVFSVQSDQDPAIPLLREIQEEFGSNLVTVAIENYQAGPNGKSNNLLGGLAHAKHDILVISDSDVRLRPDYLKAIVAPLSDPLVGYACTFYKAVKADTWFEKMELLTVNTDLTPGQIFAYMTGAAQFCLGASTALRRSDLEQIGGFESLGDYLVEDCEMGRRLRLTGKRPAMVPYLVDMLVDLKTAMEWWHHQIYWDQNNRAARPGAWLSTIVIRPVPFAALFAAICGADLIGLSVLAGAILVRIATAAAIMKGTLNDREGLRSLFLLPFRDLAAFVSLFLAFTKSTTVWRGVRFRLTGDGRLVAERQSQCATSSSPATTSASPFR